MTSVIIGIALTVLNMIPIPFLAPISHAYAVSHFAQEAEPMMLEEALDSDSLSSPALPSGITITIEQQ